MRGTRSWKWMALAGAVMVAVAQGCSDEAVATSDNPHEQADAGTTPDAGAPVMLDDAQIARVVQLVNEGEVLLGQLGQAQATNTAVRDFNTRMVTEHTAVLQRLNTLLQQQGITPADSALSQQLQEDALRIMAALQQAPAASFDLALMDAQVVAHAKTAFLGDTLLAPQVQNAPLAQELQAQRQTVQMHLQEAADVQNTVFPAPAP